MTLKRLTLSRRLGVLASIAAGTLVLGAGVATGAAAVTPVAQKCSDAALADLPPHTGFQIAPACVSTEFGAVTTQDKNASLLIVGAPIFTRTGRDFTLKVSSKNLVRDRFLAAGQGGYYLESATLDANGLTHGHMHVACRSLASGRVAPAADPVPEFFQAIEDNKGGAEADTVTVTVPGKNADGTDRFKRNTQVQCTAWAGDGSHRTPMMQRANQTPAIDSVRVRVIG